MGQGGEWGASNNNEIIIMIIIIIIMVIVIVIIVIIVTCDIPFTSRVPEVLAGLEEVLQCAFALVHTKSK